MAFWVITGNNPNQNLSSQNPIISLNHLQHKSKTERMRMKWKVLLLPISPQLSDETGCCCKSDLHCLRGIARCAPVRSAIPLPQFPLPILFPPFLLSLLFSLFLRPHRVLQHLGYLGSRHFHWLLRTSTDANSIQIWSVSGTAYWNLHRIEQCS